MFNLTFAPQGQAPLYRQLYETLRREIAQGGLSGGERLPSKRALAAHLGLSLNTVDAAYQMLIAEGYVESRPRQGVFVCPQGARDLVPPPDGAGEIVPDAPPRPRWLYDFSTSSIDVSLFPDRTWARISREVLRDAPRLLNHGDPQGDECLRSAVAQYLHEYRGVRCRPAQVVIGAGTEYLLGLAVRLLGEGASVAIEDPGYMKPRRVLQNSGVATAGVPVDAQGMDPGRLLASGCTAAYITPSHQFPTGVTMPAPRRAALLRWAAQTGGFLLEDDYDSEFRFDGRPIPALQGLDDSGRVIYIGTFSKSLAPSIRVAYLVLPERLLEGWRDRFGAYSSTVPRLEQHTLSRFMAGGHFARHINRIRSAYRGRRDALVAALRRELGGLAVPQCVHTGLHMPVALANGMDEPALKASAAAQGVRLTVLGDYRLHSPSGAPTVILGYGGLTADDIEKAVSLLGRAWRA